MKTQVATVSDNEVILEDEELFVTFHRESGTLTRLERKSTH